MASPIKGTHPAIWKLVNALGIDTKTLFTNRVVIDIDVRDVVRMYIQAMPTEQQIEEAVRIVETTRLDAPNSDFAEFVCVDAIAIDELGNVEVVPRKV